VIDVALREARGTFLVRVTFVPAVVLPADASPSALWFVVRQNALLVRSETSHVELPEPEDLARLGLNPSAAHYLGRLDEKDCFALDANGVEVVAPWNAQGLRALYGQLPEEVFGVAGRALQIVTFAATHRFCGGCGKPTESDGSERCVRCRACDLAFYHRISPANIVLVRRGEQALLARSARFTTGFYSTLAGFVEPGESLEQTLKREVLEEVSIEVDNIRYFGSQPWPFPHSLMVGFIADYAAGQIAVDGQEIVDARWFSPRDLPPIPPKLSIARRLIDRWLSDVSGVREASAVPE
jgi:NAD+ diphosphatase